MNTRRTMHRRLFVVAAVGAAGAAILRAQEPPARQGAADPLMDPSRVGQTRAVATPLDNAEEIKAIEKQLKCTCGCNLDIFTCRTTDFTCTYSPELHNEIVAMHTAGQDADQIIAAFVSKYGEQSLLAPRASGFNLLGYLLPSVAVAAVGGALGFLLLRRHRARLLAAAPVPVAGAAGMQLDEHQRKELEEALQEVQR